MKEAFIKLIYSTTISWNSWMLRIFAKAYFAAKKSLMWSLWTISSLKAYEPVLGDFIILITFVKLFPLPLFSVATTFFAMSLYFISLWRVTLFNMGLNFFNSRRSVVFFLFLVVMYRDVPGLPLSLCSVHSMITCILFLLLPILLRI